MPPKKKAKSATERKKTIEENIVTPTPQNTDEARSCPQYSFLSSIKFPQVQPRIRRSTDIDSKKPQSVVPTYPIRNVPVSPNPSSTSTAKKPPVPEDSSSSNSNSLSKREATTKESILVKSRQKSASPFRPTMPKAQTDLSCKMETSKDSPSESSNSNSVSKREATTKESILVKTRQKSASPFRSTTQKAQADLSSKMETSKDSPSESSKSISKRQISTRKSILDQNRRRSVPIRQKASTSQDDVENKLTTGREYSPPDNSRRSYRDDCDGTTTPPRFTSPPKSPVNPEKMRHIRNFVKLCQSIQTAQLQNTFNSLPKPNKNLECKAFLQNRDKNRYGDVACLDSTRILLGDSMDYIHANKLMHESLNVPYILTQGPIRATSGDFWRMVWQENSTKLFMLCKSVENNKKKCSEYFHRCGTLEPWQLCMEHKPSLYSVTHGDIVVTPLQQKFEEGLIVTELKVSRGNTSRRLMHYQCTDWGDHSAPPPNANKMIGKLCKEMDSVKYPETLVIHCSAGVGRSGTLAAIQMALHEIQNGKPIDVLKVVNRLRRARSHAVQTLDQYAFIYKYLLHVFEQKQWITQAEATVFNKTYEEVSKRK